MRAGMWSKIHRNKHKVRRKPNERRKMITGRKTETGNGKTGSKQWNWAKRLEDSKDRK